LTDNELIFPLDAEYLRKRSIRGAAVTSAAQVARLFLMLASQILLARLLLPADFGILAMVAPVLGFVTTLADMGAVQSVVQRPHITHRILNSFFWLNFLLTVVLAGVIWGLSPLLAAFYGEPRVMPVATALALLVILTGFSMQQSALLNRTMRFTSLAIVDTAAPMTNIVVSAYFAWHGFGYWALVLGQLASGISSAVLLWTMSTWRPSWPALSAEAVAMLKFGGSITVSNVALYLNSVLDNVIIGFYLGEVALGLYDRAWKLAVMPIGQLMAPINRVAVPTLSRLAEEPERYRRIFLRMMRVLFLVSLPGLAVAVAAADPLILLLFTARWQAAAPVFAWLCAGMLLTPINTAMFWLFLSQGRPKDQMVFGTIAAVINVATYWVGVHWGLVGVPITSTLVAYFVPTPLLIWGGTRRGPINLRLLLGQTYPFALATTMSMITVHYGMAYFLQPHILEMSAAFAGSYLTSFAVLSCFAAGRETLRDFAEMMNLLVLQLFGKST
jgi:PST family polysaccharide transporter